MTFKSTLIAAAVLLTCHVGQAQTAQDVAAEMRQMREELRQLRAELDALKVQKMSAPNSEAATAIAPLSQAHKEVTTEATTETNPRVLYNGNAPETPVNAVNLFGYGELNFTRPKNNIAGSEATARRAVLGFGYKFNERTRFAAELEVEHAVVSKNDSGEVAFEQLYVEHDIADGLSAKMGLFLLPVGYMNESHEPTRYFGVTRNLVETAIIPSTWRELGLGLRGL